MTEKAISLSTLKEVLSRIPAGGSSGTEKTWTTLLDVTVESADIHSYEVNNLSGLTELYMECGELINESTVSSAAALLVNNYQIFNNAGTIARAGDKAKYNWLYAKCINDKWIVLRSVDTISQSTQGGSTPQAPYNVISAGEALSVSINQPAVQTYRAVQGWFRLWGR